MNPKLAWKYFRISAFDTSTEEGRFDERYRLALLSLIANVFSRAAGLVVTVISVKLTIPYLGAERFGAWMTIASIIGLLSFLDLGVGNALANQVSYAAASGSSLRLRRIVSGGLAFLFALGALVSFGLYLASSVLPWQEIIKTGVPVDKAEVAQAVSLVAILFGLSIFSGGAQRIFAGLQKAYEAHLVNLGFSLVSLGLLLVATRYHAGIPVLVAILLGCQISSGLFLVLVLMQRNIFVPAGAVYSALDHRHHLMRTGAAFLILQVGWSVAAGIDNVLIMTIQGAAQVAVFSVAQRLFQFITQPLLVMNAPLWAAYADASARGERRFISKTFRRSMALTALLSLLGGGSVVLIGNALARWWTGGVITLPPSLLLGFFFLTSIETTSNALSVMLNGCGIIREQVIAVIILTSLALTIKPVVLRYWGVSEMLVAYAAVYCLVLGVIYGVVYRKRLAMAL